MPNFELIGVEAVIAGMAAFQRDAQTVNSLLDSVNKNTQDLGKQSLTSFGAVESASAGALSAMVAFGAAAVTTAAAVTAAAVGIAASFEQNILRTGVVAGASAQQIDELGASIINVGNNSRIGLGEIAQASNELARSGISLTAIEGGVLDATVKLAEASGGQLGLAQASRLVSEAMLAWGLSASDVTTVTSTLTAVANSSSIQFGDLQSILRQTAPIAAGLGISVQDLGAAIGIVGKAGVSGFISGSALKDVLVKLADPTKKAADEMRQYGLRITDAFGNILPLRDIIGRLNAAFGDQAIASGKVTEATRAQALAQLFGTRGIEAGIALARGGTAAFDAMQEAIKNTDPSILAAKMRDSLIPQMDRFRNIMDGVIAVIGTPLERALANGLARFSDFIAAIDPKVPKAFGDALLAAFSGKGIETVSAELTNVFGSRFGQIFTGALNVILSVRSAILDRLVPAFATLLQAAFGGRDAIQSFGNALNSIASGITTAAKAVQGAILSLANIVRTIRDAAAQSSFLTAALQALAAVPLVGLVLILGRVALALAGIGIQLALFSAAFAVVENIVRRVGATWDGTLGGMVTSVRALPPELQLVVAAVTAVATVIAVNLVVGAVTSAIAAFNIFSLSLGRTIATIDLVISRIIVFGAELLLVAVDVGIATAALIVNTTLAIAGQITALGQLIISVGAAVVSYGLLAVTIIANVVPSLALVATGVAAAAVEFAVAGVEGVIAFSLALGTLATVAIPAIISVLPLLIAGVASLAVEMSVAAIEAITAFIASLTTLSTTALPAAIAAVRTFAVAIATTAVEALAAVVTAIAPFVVGVAAIAAIAAAVYIAWQNNFLGIRDIAATVINFVVDRIREFLNTIAQIPIVSQVIGAAADAFNNMKSIAVPVVAEVKTAFVNLFAIIGGGFAQATTETQIYQNALDELLAHLQAVSNAQRQLAREGAGVGGQGILALPSAEGQREAAGVGQQQPATGFTNGVPTARLLKAQDAIAAQNEAIALKKLEESMGLIEKTAKNARAANDALTDTFERALSVLPGNTQALAAYIAELNKGDPGRAQGLIAVLFQHKAQLDLIAASHAHILVLEQAEAQVQTQINAIDAQQAALQLQREQATIGLQEQINGLDQQRLAIEGQLLPIENAIRAVDEQIAQLQRTNYVLQGQILQVEQQELPTKQAIAELDRQIAIASRASVANIVQEAQLNAQALPLKQKIADIDTQINRLSENRVTLLQRQQEILQAASVRNLTQQLDSVNKQLDAAWQTLNVPQILALQAQKDQLTSSVSTAQDQLTAIQDQQKNTSDTAELASIQLKLQKQDLLDLLNPLDDQITALQNQDALYKANQDIIVASLTEQKAKLQEVLDPLDKQLTDLQNIQATQKAASDIAINALEQQKAKLEDLAQPLRDRLTDINNQIGALQNQLAQINATYDGYKLKLDANQLPLKTELLSLQAAHLEETNRFNDLTLDYINALVQSGAFTLGEAAETAKRLGFYDSEIQKIVDLALSFSGGPNSVVDAVNAVTTAINNIPKDVTVTVHVKTSNIPSFQFGGTVPGPLGKPQLAVVHGGEQFLGVGSTTPAFANAATTRNTAAQPVINNYNYEVAATYTQPQSQASIGLDLRALIAMTQR